MRPLAAALLVVACVTASGCKREKAAPPATPTPTPEPSPAASRAAGPAELSYFEPAADGCAWMRRDVATGASAAIATVPGRCEVARVAWNAERTRGLIWTESGDATSLYEVFDGVIASRPLPPIGSVRDAGFDASGVLLALTLDEIPLKEAKSGFAMAEGAKLPVPLEMDGIPVLARAFRWEGGAWKRIETKVSDDAWDLAAGVSALDAEKALGERSWKLLARTPDGRVATPAETKILDAGCPRKAPDDGSWFRLATESANVFVRLEESDFVVVLPPLCTLDAKGAAAAPLVLDLDAEDSIAAHIAGTWLLVSASDGRRPHLVDLPTRKIAWSSKTATEAVFRP